MSLDLTAGLRALARRRSAAPMREEVRAPTRCADPAPRALPLIPGGEDVRGSGGRCCRVVRSLESLLPGADLAGELDRSLRFLATCAPEDVYPGLRPAIGVRAEDVAVMDLETTGFWGCPIFLVGLLLTEGGQLRSVQFLARDYPEERAILAETAERLAGSRLLVTFNGKSYDVPCLKERSVLHRVPSRVHRLPHVDILHAARRRWKRELMDCRLQTLEREITGLHRTGDVPSAEIPAVYHDFVASRDEEALRPVLHHARVDVLTTARLFARLAADPPPPAPKPRPKADRKRKAGKGAAVEG